MTNNMEAPCTLWGETFDADSIVEIQTLDNQVCIHIFTPNNRLWYEIYSPSVKWRGQRDELLKEAIMTIAKPLNKAKTELKVMKWISVKEDLPKHGDKNIIALWRHPELGTTTTRSMYDLSKEKPYWHYFGGRLHSDRMFASRQCVTHWLKLPELPKGENK